MRITDDKLRGRVVLSGDGIAIGDVSKLLIDGAQFTIASVEVKLRKEIAERMGIERSLWHGATVEIPATAVRSVGDAVLLSVTVDEVRMMSVASAAARGEDQDKHDKLRARPAGTTPPPPDRRDREPAADATQGGLVDERGQTVGRPVDQREGEGHTVDVRELRDQARPHPQR